MVSKIITKEKERQEVILGLRDEDMDDRMYCSIRVVNHKQSLINLKEYMKEELEAWEIVSCAVKGAYPYMNLERIKTIKEDIAELTKMIEVYA